MLAPTTTSRVTPSLKVSEKYQIINFVTSALTESLFTSNNSFIFTTVPDSNLVVSAALQVEAYLEDSCELIVILECCCPRSENFCAAAKNGLVFHRQ